jgi:hypothetical protein
MSDFNVKLDTETAGDIAVQYLTHLLDNDHFPENKEIEFMLACQEVLHFIMIPQEWEERFGKDFVEYSENTQDATEWWEHECFRQERDVISFPKGVECDWCGITEETYKHNKKTIERIKLYDEMRNEG